MTPIALALFALASFAAVGLYDQSVAEMLRQRFPDSVYLLLDARTGEVIRSQWKDADTPIPLGSLTKPLLAITAGAGAPASHRCSPGACWLRPGHGNVDLKSAIAHSCNSYFLELARELDRPRLNALLRQLGLLAVSPELPAEALVGLRKAWQIAPTELARAFLRMPASPDGAAVRQGMREAARTGTARLLGVDALAKTATAPCSHATRSPGDGYVLALYPATRPRYLLFVQAHGTTGFDTSRVAGAMLRVIRDGR